MAQTLTDKNVIVRKQRQCYSCFRKYESGSKMNYWTGLYEGEFNAVYSCMTCNEIMRMSSEHEFPEGYVHQMLSEGETPETLLETWKQTN